MNKMDNDLDLRVITIVYDEETSDVDINWDEGSMSGFEAWAILLAAAELQHDALWADQVEVEEEDAG